MTLSPRHEALFRVAGVTFLTAKGLTCIEADKITLQLDEHKIMTVVKGKLASSYNSSELRQEREAFQELEQPINKAWKLTVTDWDITFPYQFNFAEAFHEDFVSLVKWLKNLHKQIKSSDTAASSSSTEHSILPDIIVNVSRGAVSVEDDPFEVKLRYNYELMEDEYQESCKRKKAFSARIQELQRSGAFLTSSKMEELHKNLKEKDSETYIKRSKQMYESTPVRSPLFTWVMKDFLLFAMADTTMNGKDKILQHMEDIDSCP